jgi:hypothetical protein
MKRWISVALILVPVVLSAASFWDGTAALQRGDSAFEAGMFAASNSFAPDTQIVVQNLETGKTATVTITKSIAGQPDIRVTLPSAQPTTGVASGAEQESSRDPDINPGAAYAAATPAPGTQAVASAPVLPLVEGFPAATAPSPVATAEPAPTTTPEAPAPEQPPAEQPTAAVAAPAQATPEVQVAQLPEPEPAAPAQEAAAQEQQTVATGQQTATAEQPPAAQEQGTAADEAARAREDAGILASAAQRTPQKMVFLPPREDSTFAYHPPAATGTGTVAQAAAAETTPAAAEEPRITAVIGEPGAAPAATEQPPKLAEASAPPESEAQEIVGAESVPPETAPAATVAALAEPQPAPEEAGSAPAVAAAEPVQTEVTGPSATPPAAAPAPVVALLAPEAPAPAPAVTTTASTGQAAEQQGQQVAAAVSPAASATAPVTTRPAAAGTQDTWYVQLAAYATEKGAQDLATKLSSTYPARVIAPTPTGARMYRVLIGPLNKAESGTLLVWFRFRGFPDAFVKQE